MKVMKLPVTLSERVEAKLISNFSSIHCVGEILFVGKNKQHSFSQLILKPEPIIRTWKRNQLQILIHPIQLV